jgi:hypothetical protein
MVGVIGGMVCKIGLGIGLVVDINARVGIVETVAVTAIVGVIVCDIVGMRDFGCVDGVNVDDIVANVIFDVGEIEGTFNVY